VLHDALAEDLQLGQTLLEDIRLGEDLAQAKRQLLHVEVLHHCVLLKLSLEGDIWDYGRRSLL
jgi:hypothetical protein